jgi:hypothetical protein
MTKGEFMNHYKDQLELQFSEGSSINNNNLADCEKFLVLLKLVIIKMTDRCNSSHLAKSNDFYDIKKLFCIPNLQGVKAYISELSNKYKFEFIYGCEELVTECRLKYDFSVCKKFLEIIEELYKKKQR